MLIEAGADVNKTDHDHFTPLMHGIYMGVLRDRVPQVFLLIYEQKNLRYPIAEHAHIYLL